MCEHPRVSIDDLKTCKLDSNVDLRLPVIPAKLNALAVTKVSIQDYPDQTLLNLKSSSIQCSPLAVAASPVLISSQASVESVTDDCKHDQKDAECPSVLQLNVQFKPELNDLDVLKSMNLRAGDSLGIVWTNADVEVDLVINAQPEANRFQASDWIQLTYNGEPILGSNVWFNHLPSHPVQVRQLLRSHVELRTIPKKVTLKALADCCHDAQDERRLLELSSRQASTDYDQCVLRNYVTILDILRSFRSCRPPLAVLLAHLTPLRPRSFSLTHFEFDQRHGLRVQMAVSILKRSNVYERGQSESFGVISGQMYRTWIDTRSAANEQIDHSNKNQSDPLDQLNQQLNCLHLNTSLSPEMPLFAYKRKNTDFWLPANCVRSPIVLISCGTGLAPFISFLNQLDQERNYQAQSKPEVIAENQTNQNTNQTRIVLIHGCRDSSAFIYKSKIEQHVTSGLLQRLFVCYSRNPPKSTVAGTKYVQHVVQQERLFLKPFLANPDCLLFVCGHANTMQPAVKQAIVEHVLDSPSVDAMITSGRYLVDNWA